MIKFFRKIRQRLLTENKFSKYFLYAIGEIVLVIVGILIALAINNRNQLRQNEDKVKLLLAKTQSDLLVDVVEANRVLEWMHRKDSLLNLVLTTQLSKKDYAIGKGFQTAITSYDNMDFSDNSYQLLVQNINIIPDKYTGILDALNKLHIVDKSGIQRFNKKIEDAVHQVLNKWAQNHTWYAGYMDKYKSDEAVNYFITDPFYKNDVAIFKNLIGSNQIQQVEKYKYRSAFCYVTIDNILNTGKQLPKEIKSITVYVPDDVLETYIGPYQHKDYESVKLNLYIRDGILNLAAKDSVRNKLDLKLFAMSDSSFVNPRTRFNLFFNKNDKNEVMGFTLSLDDEGVEYIRINQEKNEPKQ